MLRLTFHGGAGDVTGANHLLEWSPSNSSGQSTRILVDCGMFQGSKVCENRNWDYFSYDPKSIDALFVTHGHLDHIGRIPKLVKDGFRGKIYSTPPTRDFSEVMLVDSLGVLKKEARRDKRRPFYEKKDVEKALRQWKIVDYDKPFEVADFKIVFRDAGHILGSAIIEIEAQNRRVVFTGDLGNPPTPLLKATHKVKEADYVVIESTYGDRLHEGKKERKLKLERVIEDTIKKGGVLMVPAFSIERTQELLFELNDLVENGRIPEVPIFLDSPLAIKATAIYKKHEKYYNKKAKYIINSGDDVFKFPGLKFTLTTRESKAINDVPSPKIVIAGSGMSTGGRILHHEKRYLSDFKSTLLLVCYQAAGSLGRRIKEGEKIVKIMGKDVVVQANIVEIDGYSAHPDMDGLYDFVERIKNIKKVFVVQGEMRAAGFFSQHLRDYLGIEATAPEIANSFVLD